MYEVDAVAHLHANGTNDLRYDDLAASAELLV
jgi:hypothetical protein